jgi:hypothetical protein
VWRTISVYYVTIVSLVITGVITFLLLFVTFCYFLLPVLLLFVTFYYRCYYFLLLFITGTVPGDIGVLCYDCFAGYYFLLLFVTFYYRCCYFLLPPAGTNNIDRVVRALWQLAILPA